MNNLGEKAPAQLESAKVSVHRLGADEAGQRIDNFLLRLAKGGPKSHVYRVIRGGEVRVNRRRVDVSYRLVAGDEVRLPPMRTSSVPVRHVPGGEFPVLFEDEAMLVIDKPAGVAVHGGSGVAFGVIEQLRAARPESAGLELVHRLDRDTSGVLMLAKKRSALTALHEQIRLGEIEKHYLALVRGSWNNARQHIKAPLLKYLLADGERRVRVDQAGSAAHTIVTLARRLGEYSLLEVELKTGRTHQIRVHLAHLGFPIVGDAKYGDFESNHALARVRGEVSFKRMFLHAQRLVLHHPLTRQALTIEAPLPVDCEAFIEQLGHAETI
jgi:23S rRNA pseudouridine955/2504/2580 synthase